MKGNKKQIANNETGSKINAKFQDLIKDNIEELGDDIKYSLIPNY